MTTHRLIRAAAIALFLVLGVAMCVSSSHAASTQISTTRGTTGVSDTLTAQNTFSDATAVQGHFNLSLSGTWSATVHLQRSFDGGSTWLDVASYTAKIEDRGYEAEPGVLYRFGVKTGNYSSGSVVGRISTAGVK